LLAQGATPLLSSTAERSSDPGEHELDPPLRAVRPPGASLYVPPALERIARLGFAVDEAAGGRPAASVWSLEPSQGDPRFVAVLPHGDQEAFWIDRRTMRAVRTPRSSLASEHDVVRAADLADRVHLALGEPVALQLTFAKEAAGGQGESERLQVSAVDAQHVELSFTPISYRRVAPFVGDHSTLSPLSVDALDRALRVEEDRGDEHRVRRLFGRAYRKVDAHHTPWSRGGRGPLRSLGRLLRLTRDVTLCLSDAERFRRALSESVTAHDTIDLGQLDRSDLIEALRRRMSMVVSALVLLERSRMATLALLPALEQLCGEVPRDAFAALAAPAYGAERAAIDQKLGALAERCLRADGALQTPAPESGAAQEWQKLRRTLRHVRGLGMDVRTAAIGSDDDHLLLALHEVRARGAQQAERQRRAARERLAARALRGSLGPLGVAPALGLVTLLGRLAQAKGGVAEGLAAALLRLRAGALEAGRRLSNDGLLERPGDTLYMTLEEIEQALEGELGAYAARVRLRREDDRRWRNFAAPRLIRARGGA
jgi:hypothetical protein